MAGAATPAMAAQTVHSDDSRTVLPQKLVNGDFEYPGWDMLIGGNHRPEFGWSDWTSVTPDGYSYNRDSYNSWTAMPGFDHGRFGWTSTQEDLGGEARARAVELQHEDKTGNIYAEIVAAQPGRAIYQDIDTTGGPAMYAVELDHTSMSSSYLDKMQVLIGPPGHETPVQMTRVTINGNGDQVGETSDVIATKADNKPQLCDVNNTVKCTARNHADQWETYRGTVVVPANQPVTRFTFRSVDSSTYNYGNLVDNISFEKGYPLTYDGNGNTGGTLPQQTN